MDDTYFTDLTETMRRLNAPLEQMRRQMIEPSAAMLAMQEQIRQLTQPSSTLANLNEQIRSAALHTTAFRDQLRDLAASPGLLAMQEQMRTASTVMQEQIRSLTPAMHHVQERMQLLAPAILRAQEQWQSMAPAIHAAGEQMRQIREAIDVGALHRFSEQMRQAFEPMPAVLAMREQWQLAFEGADRFRAAMSIAGVAGSFPAATTFDALFAKQLVDVARSQGEIDAILGTSFAVDALAGADEFADEAPTPEEFMGLLDSILAAFRRYLERVASVIDLAHLYQTANLLVAFALLYYAMQSPTAQDITHLRDAVTATTRQEFEASRQQFADQMSKLSKAIEKLSEDKLVTLGPASIYRVDRTIPVKIQRKMKSETIGWLQFGQPVFVVARDKKWVEIEYIDLLTGRRARGWVVKKYLTRLQ